VPEIVPTPRANPGGGWCAPTTPAQHHRIRDERHQFERRAAAYAKNAHRRNVAGWEGQQEQVVPDWRFGAVSSSVADDMAKLKSAFVVFFTVWALEALIVIPLMAIRGASGTALTGAFVFGALVALLIVGLPIVVSESRARHNR
jgi:hypothetical protein